MTPPTSSQTSNIITTNVFLGKFLQLDKFISEKEKKHEKASWFFNALKMPRSRYGDLINITQYGASFLLQCLKNHQTCSYPLLPVLGGYQKQEKKDPRLFSVQFLAFIITVLKRIGKKREKKTAFITTSSLMRIANSLRLFEITRTSILKYLKTDPAVIKTIKYPPNTGLYFKTDKVATYIKRL